MRYAGDVNADYNLDNKDVVALFRYLSGSKVEVVKSLIDLNYDGWSDNKDIVVLFKYVSSKK